MGEHVGGRGCLPVSGDGCLLVQGLGVAGSGSPGMGATGSQHSRLNRAFSHLGWESGPYWRICRVLLERRLWAMATPSAPSQGHGAPPSCSVEKTKSVSLNIGYKTGIPLLHKKKKSKKLLVHLSDASYSSWPSNFE